MSESVLQSTKKVLGLEPEDPSFDTDVMMLINSAFFTMSQIGVGPAAGYSIQNATTTWEDLLGTSESVHAVQNVVYLKVRVAFDPPTNPAVLTALEKQIHELEWRLNVERELTDWVDPTPRLPSEDVFGDPITIDGGTG